MGRFLAQYDLVARARPSLEQILNPRFAPVLEGGRYAELSSKLKQFHESLSEEEWKSDAGQVIREMLERFGFEEEKRHGS